MNKFKKIFLALKLLSKKPSLINLITGSDEKWDGYLLKKHPKKTRLPIVALEDLIPDFNETLNTFSFLGGGSLPTDIMLLKGLCAKTPNCNYFEIHYLLIYLNSAYTNETSNTITNRSQNYPSLRLFFAEYGYNS